MAEYEGVTAELDSRVVEQDGKAVIPRKQILFQGNNGKCVIGGYDAIIHLQDFPRLSKYDRSETGEFEFIPDYPGKTSVTYKNDYNAEFISVMDTSDELNIKSEQRLNIDFQFDGESGEIYYVGIHGCEIDDIRAGERNILNTDN